MKIDKGRYPLRPRKLTLGDCKIIERQNREMDDLWEKQLLRDGFVYDRELNEVLVYIRPNGGADAK